MVRSNNGVKPADSDFVLIDERHSVSTPHEEASSHGHLVTELLGRCEIQVVTSGHTVLETELSGRCEMEAQEGPTGQVLSPAFNLNEYPSLASASSDGRKLESRRGRVPEST